MNGWIYDKGITPHEYEGFVYLITNIQTGQMYVGQKSLWSYRKRKPKHESEWADYYGSSKPLLADIALLGKDQFKREVLIWCRTKGELTMMEASQQFKRDVLSARMPNGQKLYYNANILRRFYAEKDVR